MCGVTRKTAIVIAAALTSLLAGPGSIGAQALPASASDPVALVRAWLDATDAASRREIARALVAHREYRPSRVGEWLHRAATFPAVRPGIEELRVDVGGGDIRQVVVRVPAGYRPDRAWPLIYALHPSGMPAAEWVGHVERLLGGSAGLYVIAAPDQFRQNYIAARPPFTPEHPAILDAVARRIHVAADRVYALGYSKGGFGAWFVSLYYPDRFAGAVAMASAFDVAVEDDGFWKALVTNVAHLPVLNVWGERDTMQVPGLDEKPAGSFADQNRRFRLWVSGMGLPITNIEVEGAGHTDVSLPMGQLQTVLAGRRREDPRRIDHVFRHLHQASSYWLEGLSWEGGHWGESPPSLPAPSEGETPRHTLARTLASLLGRLTGTIDGQTIRVTRRHVGAMVVWFGDRTIDWTRPVVIEVDGAKVFDGLIARDIGVSLARAAATRDFDTLRWAGILVDEAGKATPVTSETMPQMAWKR